MQNNQKGFVVPLLIAIIALLLIVGGFYIYSIQQKNDAAMVGLSGNDSAASPSISGGTSVSSSAPSSPVPPNSPAFPSSPTASGETAALPMQQYTDPTFGFSFWYPGNWQVTKVNPNIHSDNNITSGDVMSTLVVGEKDTSGNTNPRISIQEVHSASLLITDEFETGTNPTYYFDPSIHTWMTVGEDNYGRADATTSADVSTNTMGGLHMLSSPNQSQDVSSIIIPLSAADFLVVNAIGGVSNVPLAATITATDPSVATPVSSALQNQAIQNEAGAYAAIAPSATLWKTYTDAQGADSSGGFSFQYPNQISGVDIVPNGTPQVFVTANGTNIDNAGCYIDQVDGPGPTPDSQVTINNIHFCVSSGGSPGAGQLYRSSYYTTQHNGSYVTIGYTIHTSNGCGVFEGDPAYLSCEYLFNNYASVVTAPIEKSVGSLNFSS